MKEMEAQQKERCKRMVQAIYRYYGKSEEEVNEAIQRIEKNGSVRLTSRSDKHTRTKRR